MAGLSLVLPAVALFLAQVSPTPGPGDAVEARYQFGLALGRAGDFDGAEKAFRAVLQVRPQDAGAHFNLGIALIGDSARKLDWSAAMAEFRAALEQRPHYNEARRMLAECLLNTGEAAAAVRELETLLKEEPAYAQARFSLACALEANSHLDRAILELRQVTTEKPELAEPHAMLGKLLSRMGKRPEALAELEKSLRINPDLADAHLTLARLLRDNGDAGAEIELAQGQRLARRDNEAIRAVRLSNQGLDAAAKGDIPGALALLRQSVETKPEYALAHYNLGLLLADSGDYRRATDEFHLAASLAPTLAKPWYSLGQVLEKVGDPDSALGAMERAAQLDPEDTRAASLAKELRARGARSKPPRDTPNTAKGHSNAGVDRSRAGDWLGAMGEFLRALKIQPDFADARYNLAIAMYQAKYRDGAELELRKVLLLRADAASHYALGVILKEKGVPAARAEFEAALDLEPTNVMARRELDSYGPPR